MSNAASINEETIQQWMLSKRSAEHIEAELLENGLDSETISTHLSAFKRLRNTKRQNTGFMYMGVGAVLGFISCVLTLANIIPGMFNIILYGLTSIALIFIMLGLYYVME
jgi:hypothetical protein